MADVSSQTHFDGRVVFSVRGAYMRTAFEASLLYDHSKLCNSVANRVAVTITATATICFRGIRRPLITNYRTCYIALAAPPPLLTAPHALQIFLAFFGLVFPSPMRLFLIVLLPAVHTHCPKNYWQPIFMWCLPIAIRLWIPSCSPPSLQAPSSVLTSSICPRS